MNPSFRLVSTLVMVVDVKQFADRISFMAGSYDT